MSDSNSQQSTFKETPVLYWTKDAFSLNYSIFKNGEIVGEIKDSSINRSPSASLFGEKYVFEGEGIIKPRMNIIDLQKKSEIGCIYFDSLRSKAKIELKGNHYNWKFDNFLYTKWTLTDHKGNRLINGSKKKEGTFTTNNLQLPSILLLCALIIRNRFTKNGY